MRTDLVFETTFFTAVVMDRALKSRNTLEHLLMSLDCGSSLLLREDIVLVIVVFGMI